MFKRPQEPTESGYTKFRRSHAFTIMLVTLMGMWATAHIMAGFDADGFRINLTLSFEATLGLSLMARDQSLQEAFVRGMLGYIADVQDVTLELAQASWEVLKKIAEKMI
jgi:hypothetical protein